MGINGNDIKRRLEAENRKRGRVTLYLSKDVYSDFKKHCGELPASVVIDELMIEYMRTTDGPKRNKYRQLK